MLQTLTLYSPCLKPFVFIQIFEAENPSANQNANPSSANIRGRNMPLLCNRGKFEQSAEVTISNQIGRTFIARCWYFMGGGGQGGITCGAIDEPWKSLKAIDGRVIINFCNKNVVIAHFCDKNDGFLLSIHICLYFYICIIHFYIEVYVLFISI